MLGAVVSMLVECTQASRRRLGTTWLHPLPPPTLKATGVEFGLEILRICEISSTEKGPESCQAAVLTISLATANPPTPEAEFAGVDLDRHVGPTLGAAAAGARMITWCKRLMGSAELSSCSWSCEVVVVGGGCAKSRKGALVSEAEANWGSGSAATVAGLTSSLGSRVWAGMVMWRGAIWCCNEPMR